jgi:hypothetical protein
MVRFHPYFSFVGGVRSLAWRRLNQHGPDAFGAT